MSTIGGLLMPQFKPYDLGGTLEQANRIAGGQTINQTRLLELADLKAKQQAEQEFLLAIKQNPALAQQLFGGSILGSLGPAGGMPAPPGGGPMPALEPHPVTQQTLMPGQAPGAPQAVPGGQDLSRFAGVSPQGGGPIPPDVMARTMPTVTPPQSTIASLGPAGQPGQMQPQQNPLLEMAQRDPRAAMMMQQQIEQRQDAQMKRQEQQLTMGTKIMDYLGRGAQGVTDQASLDAFREESARVHPQAAASLPQTYSKEAMAPFIAKALDVKEALTLQVQDLTAQAAVIKARKEGRSVDVDNQLRAMGVQPGQETPGQIKEALQAVEDAKVRVSASHGTGQIVKGPTGEYIRVRPGTDQVEVIKGPGGEPLREKASETEQKGATLANSVAAANKLATDLEDKGYKPSVWEKGIDKLPLGLGNYVTSSDYQKYRQTVREFASAWLYGVSGAQITDSEWENANQTFFPQPNEDKAAVALKRQRRAELVRQLQQQTAATGRTGTQAQPPGQGSAGSGGQGGGVSGAFKPLKEMSREERLAERDALRAKAGR